MTKRVYLYAFNNVLEVVDMKFLKDDAISVLNIRRLANWMRGDYPEPVVIYAVDNRRGLHQEYLDDMKALQYDILYGDREIYGEESPFQATKLQMGIRPIFVDGAAVSGNTLLVYGSNFNTYSRIYIGDKALNTTYVWPELILAADVPEDELKELRPEDLTVKQTGDDNVPLGEAIKK